ncbi:MAG: L,D-transpeptidase family protein [Ignavibacterium sp.]|nr:L,D-transpeptidase family protein [Ignavibacterium sp.]MDW8376432.1 L,D-transpeptidase family protein [Ignavibacteriales bacterium]
MNFSDELKNYLVIRFNQIDSTDFLFAFIKDNFENLKSFYSTNNFKPVIFSDLKSIYIVDSLLAFFEKSNEHGINPEVYNIKVIKNELKKITEPNKSLNEKYSHIINSEILIANSLINYSTHLRQGFVDPTKLFSPNYVLPHRILSDKDKMEVLSTKNKVAFLDSIQPKSERYVRLQNALKRYESIANVNWETISLTKNKIEPGDFFPQIKNVYKRLVLLGFIDTTKFQKLTSNKYEKFLVEPVKSFQKSHGLIPDGVIGKTTIERLNITPQEYVKKIKLNLERFRWYDYTDSSKYILVNIPDFNLRIIEGKKEVSAIKVCVGRKINWQTPILYGQLSHLVLNPTWSVPQSIVQEEILSGLKKDSLYLKKRNFRAYKNGKRVDLSEINVKELKTKKIRLIQDPGAGNALGKIKFMFDNSFGVYLHDTPTRAPFNYTNRAVSHGCVRVENPYLLAEFLLKNNSEWTIDYVKLETGQQLDDKNILAEFQKVRNKLRKNFSYGKTTEVYLNNHINLFIDYFTVWVDENGILNYREDVYNKDIVLEKSLPIW